MTATAATADRRAEAVYRGLIGRIVLGEPVEEYTAAAVAAAESLTPAAIAAAAGRTMVELDRHVATIQGRRRALELIRQASRSNDTAEADRLRQEAADLLAEFGPDDALATIESARAREGAAAAKLATAIEKRDEAFANSGTWPPHHKSLSELAGATENSIAAVRVAQEAAKKATVERIAAEDTLWSIPPGFPTASE